MAEPTLQRAGAYTLATAVGGVPQTHIAKSMGISSCYRRE